MGRIKLNAGKFQYDRFNSLLKQRFRFMDFLLPTEIVDIRPFVYAGAKIMLSSMSEL